MERGWVASPIKLSNVPNSEAHFLLGFLVSADQEKTGCNVAPCTEGNCG